MEENKSGNNRQSIISAIQGNSVAVAAVLIVLMLFIPLPKMIIDVAMVVNLALALVILLTVIYTRRAADFSSFPRVILLVTLFGLAINISSTRLILLPGENIPASLLMNTQSEMVKAFANIVAGDNIVVGFIIFIILIVVQVIVVTKGAGRISEVSARFTLDSMNSKMFDIQNDLNSGAITEEEAEKRKEEIRREVDFYSTMDGSSKFVSGNVKAGIFITAVNLIGGMITGMVFHNMAAGEAMDTYAKLTIGDGLLSQLPALLVSFSTGILVTGSRADEFIGDELKRNFSVSGTIYVIVGIALAAMGLAFHNASAFVLVPIGAIFVYLGIRMQRMQKTEAERAAEAAKNAKSNKQTGGSPDEVSPVVTLDPLSLDLGYALVPLVDREKGAELLERVTRIRREEALDLGLVVPPIRIRDSMSIDPDEYSFKIRGIEVGKSKLKLGYYMCLNTGNVDPKRAIVGEKTKDPAFGMEAIWVSEPKRLEAEKAGYAVIDPPTIIATHLTEIIRRHASDILSRQEVSSIINKVKETNPVVVDEILSGEHKLTYGEIESVLKNLLNEQVSIRNMVVILETLANFAPITKDPWILTEKVREALGAQICLQYADDDRVLHVMRLSQTLAQNILDHQVMQPGQKPFVAFDPVDGRKYIETMSASFAAVSERNYLPIVLCPDQVRLLVHSSTEREIPGLVCISVSEVMAAGSGIKVETIGDIDVQD
ncbi:MAG TPA: EscV/YscV/HrcV family type III secretion system export apparatus protein [Treponema sp.]|nr:EscV/YscV/HrcV family type III secretion system export apparatus protein [Treponema sp.]